MQTVWRPGVGGKCGFAGKRDWRVPNVKELQSIVNYEIINLAVSPTFDTNCVAGVTVLTGSCTASSLYSSSSTFAVDPSFALGVDFFDGGVKAGFKSGFFNPVRAVRGGSP